MFHFLLLIIIAVFSAPLAKAEPCSVAIEDENKASEFPWLSRITIDEGSIAAVYPETYGNLVAMLAEVVELPVLIYEKKYTNADFYRIFEDYKRVTERFSERIKVLRDRHLKEFGGQKSYKTLEQRILLKTLTQLTWMIKAHEEPYCRKLVKARDSLYEISNKPMNHGLTHCGNLNGMLKMPAQLLISVVIGLRFADFFTNSVPLHHLARDISDTLEIHQPEVGPGYLAFERLDVVIIDRKTMQMSGIVIDTKGLWGELEGSVPITAPRLRTLGRQSFFIHRSFRTFALPYALNYFQVAGFDDTAKAELKAINVGWL